MDLVFISILGLIMGIVTSISGGAGVFAIPTMLAFGIPPINALALNRFSDLGVVTGALRGYQKSKSIDWKLALLIMIPLGVGSFFGSSIVVMLPEEVLRNVILVGVMTGIFLLVQPVKPKKDKKSKGKARTVLGYVLMLLVGIWSGALAMAGATFAVLVLVHCFNKNFLEGRSTDIVAAIPETLIASIVLSLGATVSFYLLFTMLASSFVGAWIGSHIAVKHGNNFIRKSMIAIAIVMIIKVVLDFI